MTKKRSNLPPSLAKKRRLTKDDRKALSESPDSPLSRAGGWLKKEAERRRLLRVIALDFFGIDENQPDWKNQYISRLEQLAFPAFEFDRFSGRPAEAEGLEPIFIVARLQFARDGDGRRLPVKRAALLLAREHLGVDAPSTKVEEKARYFIEVRKRHWRNQHERTSNRSTRNGAN